MSISVLKPKRRVVKCEEWEGLRIGEASSDLSFEEVRQIFQYWEKFTGLKPDQYFDIKGHKLTPKGWTGVAPGKTIQLEVLPIGAKSLDQRQLRILDRNISIMLQASITGGSISIPQGDIEPEGQRLQAILLAFSILLESCRRKQIIRKYSARRKSTKFIRGRTVFPHQVFESIRRPGYFFSEWVSLDEDTAENRFLKAILTRFKPKAYGNLKYKFDELICDFDRVSNISEPLREWRRIRFDRLPVDYIELLRISKSLLDGHAPGLFSGISNSNAEIVFTARTFETFIGLQISKISQSLGFKVKKQTRGQYLASWKGGKYKGVDVFEIIPDIQINSLNRSGFTCVLDTKWKRIKPESSQLGISPADIYQITAYSTKIGNSKAVLIYPWIGDIGLIEEIDSSSIKILSPDKNLSIYLLLIPMLDYGFSGLGNIIRNFIVSFEKEY